MNILLISQCHKKALKETRRIIDQFAERCGDRTWQTAMTKAGLETLHKLLRKTARKNSAIACYWTHGKNQTDLLWIVGDKKQFNQDGKVPTNRTRRNMLTPQNENLWQYGASIQLITTIAALLHDLGKATVGFQNKLRGKGQFAADPFRHEWISLQLFCLMIQGCQTDSQLLERLANFNDYQQKHPNWYLSLTKTEWMTLDTLPLLAKWIAWLIVSHHRMPFLANSTQRSKEKQRTFDFNLSGLTQDAFFQGLEAVDRWVKNSHSDHQKPADFWKLQACITQSELWLKKLSRYANKALQHKPLMQLTQMDPFLLHMSRLALMVGDHNYSSLPHKNEHHDDNQMLIANTTPLRQAKQLLDEHLIGVANFAARFAMLLPRITTELPAINQHKPFAKRTTASRFQWQNHAFDIAKQNQEKSDACGFFGVNMASTGCGKTLANARIIYALANPKRGVRLTIALGLRVLTLQTGSALRDKLQLSDEHLAILIGGTATKTLYELQYQTEQDHCDVQTNKHSATNSQFGCESADDFIDEYIDVSESGIADSEFGTIIENSNARKLLNVPIVTCTIDHIIQASECLRGGKYISPMLRLLTSDLILDEPDDFDQNDLPALARLVHLAGLLGSKVLLSSATLTPDLVTGLFDAYQSGRKIWNQHNQLTEHSVICGWFDEFQQTVTDVTTSADFIHQHNCFVQMRTKQLECSPAQRQGVILPLLDYTSDRHSREQGDLINYGRLAEQLLAKAQQFHHDHAEHDKNSDKRVSIGLMRFAHTEDIIAISKKLYQQKSIDCDTQFHLVIYHARQLLLLRSQLEEKLDAALNRTDPNALFTQPLITKAIKNSPYRNHIFIVLGTPVTEVGRDHDYDWAIIEPSSMRSIIQLVGRVWRHRPDKIATRPNVAILGSNLTAIKQGNNLGANNACFCKPGFEESPFLLLASHKSQDIISLAQLAKINAIPRIETCQIPTKTKAQTLAELEHNVMRHLLPIHADKSNYVTSYWQPGLAHHHCAHLQLISPFRNKNRKQQEYVCQLNEYGEYQFNVAEIAWQRPNEYCEGNENKRLIYQDWEFPNPQIQPWLTSSVENALTELEAKFKNESTSPIKTRYRLANEFCTVTLYCDDCWYFHPYFGFYKHA